METLTNSAAETEALAERVGAACEGGELLVLSGELGAGKTAFVRGLARGLGCDWRRIKSPSFTLHHRHAGATPLNHYDVYFTEQYEDLLRTAITELCDAGEVAVIEWGERFDRELPADRITIELSHEGPEIRRIRFAPQGERPQALIQRIFSGEN